MSRLDYRHFGDVDPGQLLPLLNSERNRAHLIGHPLFDRETAREWVDAKVATDALERCRVRVITIDDRVAGWCGIQPADEQYEVAIVLDAAHWGKGRKVFRDMMAWAGELGHSEVVLHLLHTRRAYRFLQTLAKNVYTSRIMDADFTSYVIDVDRLN